MNLKKDAKRLVDHLCERYGGNRCIVILNSENKTEVASTVMELEEGLAMLDIAAVALKESARDEG